MKISEMIEEIMIEHHLSQANLAKMLNVSQKAVSNWINEVDKPNTNSLLAIYNNFGITPNSILGIEDDDQNIQNELYSYLPNELPNKAIAFVNKYGELFDDNNFQNITKLYQAAPKELRAVALGYLIGLFQSNGVNTKKILGY